MSKDDEMTRLSKAKQERNARLRELMHGAPEGTDISRHIFSFIRGNALMGLAGSGHPDSDRHAAISCSAALEHSLRGAISLHLFHDADPRAIFENYPDAPLSSFSSRVTMARGLGIIDAASEADLDVIRRVRNQFAHTMMPIGFDQADVSSVVAEIKVMDDPDWKILEQVGSARERFIVSCAIYHARISTHRFTRPDHPSVLLANALNALHSLEASTEKSPPPRPTPK